MKKTVFAAFLISMSILAFAQKSNPVSWTFNAKKLTGNKYELRMTAALAKTWHIYSQKTPDGGPIPTFFSFSPNALVVNTGKPKEVGKLKRVKDKNFGVDVLYYSDKVDFVQTVTTKGNIKTNISGKVEYNVCDDSKCLPPTEVPFSIALK